MFALSACSAELEYDDVPHSMDPELERELATRAGAVSCPAKLKRYPVKGKHNGGWDPKALTYTCPTHPSNAKDNSDFIGGDHFGNDIFGAKGTPLVACVDGTISNVANTSIGGKNVTIKDSCGWYYYYAHMDSIAGDIKSGKKVSAGHYLGTLGKTGNAASTSPHLHFSIFPGVYKSGIDPFPLLQKVDSTSCSGGGGNPPPPPPTVKKPKIKIWSKTYPSDSLPQGKSKGIADVFEGQVFNVDVFVEVMATGGQPKGQLHIGYWVETPYLKAVTYSIHSDWPKKDKKTWKINDSDSAPGNPPKKDPPKTGKINIYAMSPGETKRIRFKLRAEKYSIGAVDHPDLRAWVWHVDNFYGEMTGFYDKVEVNGAGVELKTYRQHDVYGKTHWEWNGTAPETEGWKAGNAIAEFKVNTSAHALAVKQGGQDPYVFSPKVALKASKWKGFKARIRQYQGKQKGQLFWITGGDGAWNEAKSVVFETQGGGEFETLAINASKNPKWKGTITKFRIDPTFKSQQWFDLDWVRATEKPGKTSGDGDGDTFVSTDDCDDKNAAVNPDAAEVCDGIDNDCDGKVDEGFTKGPEVCDGQDNDCDGEVDEGVKNLCGGCGPVPVEVCDGVDNDCDGLIPAEEADLDGDGSLVCKGDCDDADATVHPGGVELCDGKDNDCDDVADEELDLGKGCTVGKGECQAKGTVICGEEFLEPVCSVAPGEPVPELCDGLDNDCDGETDEDFGLGQPCDASSPACTRVGKLVCSADGAKAVCNAAPPEPEPELCNFIDDDCDGEVDEDFPLLESCVVGNGNCESVGHWSCGADGELYCKASEIEGFPELCDGKDNDCDGLVDEGFSVGGECNVHKATCTLTGVWKCNPTGTDTECDSQGAECDPVDPPPDPGTDPGDEGTDEPPVADPDPDPQPDPPPDPPGSDPPGNEGAGTESSGSNEALNVGGEEGEDSGCQAGPAGAPAPIALWLLVLCALGLAHRRWPEPPR